VPRRRTAAFVGALLLLLLALQSAVERYDTALFGVHMLQHLILVFPVPILLLRAGPVTLALRVASPGWRRRLLAILNSRFVAATTHPLVGWILLAGTMWATHLSPIFDAALENPLVHDLEHAAYLGAALVFWAPVFAVDPVRHRLSRPAAIGYLLTQMPQNSFLGVAIMWAPTVLYAHYATIRRPWGPTPLEDQQLAGAIMWMVGDILFLLALFAVLAAWMGESERSAMRDDAARAPEIAALRRREALLADRRADEREERRG
jgi:putative copper resistance protein D